MNFIGAGNFRAIGFEFLRFFTEFCDLKQNDKVLDVGCGLGRMALPLLTYLNNGTYDGIDIVPKAIKWCREKISPKYINFHFHLSDIKNTTYNPHGKIEASDYIFPFEDKYFDFVFLTSVFTHMLSEDVDHYLHEISRVLKKNGRVFSTWFSINKESLELIANNKSAIRLSERTNFDAKVFVEKPQYPEDAVGYGEELIYSLHKKNGLEIQQPIKFGSWCGRTEFTSFQDIVIAYKR